MDTQEITETQLKDVVISIMPERLQKYICFVNVKQFTKGINTVSVGVNNEGIVFEIDYKLKSLKSVFNDLCKEVLGKDFTAHKIKAWYMKPKNTKTTKGLKMTFEEELNKQMRLLADFLTLEQAVQFNNDNADLLTSAIEFYLNNVEEFPKKRYTIKSNKDKIDVVCSSGKPYSASNAKQTYTYDLPIIKV